MDVLRNYWWIGVVAAIFFGLWLGFGLRPYMAGRATAEPFGLVNSLGSSFALAGVIIAIVLQSKELALQRKELRLTRTELKRTAKGQELSFAALKDQAESAFLGGYLNALIAELRMPHSGLFKDQQEEASERITKVAAMLGPRVDRILGNHTAASDRAATARQGLCEIIKGLQSNWAGHSEFSQATLVARQFDMAMLQAWVNARDLYLDDHDEIMITWCFDKIQKFKWPNSDDYCACAVLQLELTNRCQMVVEGLEMYYSAASS